MQSSCGVLSLFVSFKILPILCGHLDTTTFLCFCACVLLCSLLERRVVSLCGRGAEVAMHGRIHQSVVLRKLEPGKGGLGLCKGRKGA